MSKNDIIKFLILRSIGNFLLLVAIYGVFVTFGPPLWYEAAFQIAQARGVQYTVAVPGQENQTSASSAAPGFGSALFGQKQQVLLAPDTSFSIVIPKIGAAARIFPNVDASDESIFLPILMQGVAHAKGSMFPGTKGTTYLFAHSTDSWIDVSRYNAVFFLIKDLKPGDEIVIFFQGQRFNYIVQNTVIRDPSDTSLLTNSHNTSPQLVLQTCYPPGTTFERLFVIATPKSV